MWKKIFYNGIETNYSISKESEIRNDKTKKILSQQIQQGYKHITLSINKKPKRFRVHRLMAEAYIPNPKNKPYVNHIDGNRSNNKIENLEWCTPAENTQHAVNLGLMVPTREKAVIQYSLEGKKIKEYKSISEAERVTGALNSKIVLCCKLERRYHFNSQWRYKEDNLEELPPITLSKTTPKEVVQIDKDTGEVIAIFESMGQAARAVNGTQSAISRVISGVAQTKTHKGFKWKLVDEIVQS